MPRSDQAASFKLEAPYGFRAAEPGEAQAFKWRDNNHTRWNRRSPDSVATLDVQTGVDHTGEQWASIRIEEMTPNVRDVISSRVIAVSLDAKARAALLEFLLSDGKAPQP